MRTVTRLEMFLADHTAIPAIAPVVGALVEERRTARGVPWNPLAVAAARLVCALTGAHLAELESWVDDAAGNVIDP